MPVTASTCPYCGVGCGVLIEHDGTHITGVRGDPHHPANFGRLCTKGATLHLTALPPTAQTTRLLTPQVRRQRGGPLKPLSWEAAAEEAAQRIAHAIQRHGPDAVGVYVSGQLLTEDYHVFNKLVKGVLGSNHIDTNSRLCMSSAVAGYKLSLGADAPPPCYDDIAHAQTLFIAGSNTAWAHPILFRRIEDAKAARPDLRLIVIDPRRTDTAASADLHLPIRPGSDVALFHGLLHILLWEGWEDPAYIAAHTQGFEALKARVRPFHPAHTARVCGIPEADLYTAARWFAGIDRPADATAPCFAGRDGRPRSPTLSLYCQGLNQSSSGTAKNLALVALHLATGQLGHPGSGPLSLTGQPNAMGGREVGGLAHLLPGHRDVTDPEHRRQIEDLWGLTPLGRRLSPTPGRSATELFAAAAQGEIKVLWIACTNPAQSLPDQRLVHRAFERAECVIVQEAFAHTATAAYADLLLPATTWGEKDGTVTNSERRISRVRRAVAPPFDPAHPQERPRDDWRIARDIGQRIEALLHPGQPSILAADTPEAIWLEHRAATVGRDLDIGGLSYALLEQAPQQWPMPAGASQGQARLYADGRFPTPDGKARFIDLPHQEPAEACDPTYPFALTTGRLRDQWHGMSRTGLLGRLFGHTPEPSVHIHPLDAARRGLRHGQLVRLSTRRASLILPLHTSADVQLGQLFAAMHWGSECIGGRSPDGQPLTGGINALTNPAVCPLSKQPEFKHSAAALEPVDLPWTLVAFAWLPLGLDARCRQQLTPWLSRFDFAFCVPFGRLETEGLGGVLLRAASASPPPPQWLDDLGAAFGLDGPDCLRYDDPRRSLHRRLRLQRSGSDAPPALQAVLLAGDTQAEGWLKTLLQDRAPVPGPAHHLLQASSQPLLRVAATSPQVCACHNVSQRAIEAHLHATDGPAPQRLQSLQQALQCGTACGSCLPAIKQLIAQTPATAGTVAP